jgi:hypothetical protein
MVDVALTGPPPSRGSSRAQRTQAARRSSTAARQLSGDTGSCFGSGKSAPGTSGTTLPPAGLTATGVSVV